MQERHELGQITMRSEEIVAHVVGMAGRVANAQDARDLRDPLRQPRQRPGAALGALAVVGVDVLAEQRHLAHAKGRKPLDFLNDLMGGARDLCAARIGHHAECAELVAAFLHGDEGAEAARANFFRGGIGEMVEFVLNGKFRVHHPRAIARAAQEVRQAMVVLRAHHQIDGGLAAQDLGALRLGDTTGDRDLGVDAARGALLFQQANLAKLRKDLLGGMFADMAGVEHDEIGALHHRRFLIAFFRKHIGHARGVIDIHLTAVGLHKHLALAIIHLRGSVTLRLQNPNPCLG